jgi:hypothetical protein
MGIMGLGQGVSRRKCHEYLISFPAVVGYRFQIRFLSLPGDIQKMGFANFCMACDACTLLNGIPLVHTLERHPTGVLVGSIG